MAEVVNLTPAQQANVMEIVKMSGSGTICGDGDFEFNLDVLPYTVNLKIFKFIQRQVNQKAIKQLSQQYPKGRY